MVIAAAPNGRSQAGQAWAGRGSSLSAGKHRWFVAGLVLAVAMLAVYVQMLQRHTARAAAFRASLVAPVQPVGAAAATARVAMPRPRQDRSEAGHGSAPSAVAPEAMRVEIRNPRR
jgi:hypothetical protein